ncbi:MAG: hypothetical protein GX260_03975 [Tissierellia bacterium]|nr:hypothetical protein [Bacillota bacterium]NLL22922.1 hypothetical protein [Tissierellia bacterium]
MNKETMTFDDSWLDKMIEKVECLSDEERDLLDDEKNQTEERKNLLKR